MSTEPTRCKSCGAAIIFAKTVTGKSMPLNADETGVFQIGTDGIARMVYGHQTHFGTCPQSRQWSRK